MSKIVVNSITHSGNSGTENLTLDNSGNLTVAGNLSVTGIGSPILEQFFYPCNGETVTTSAGDITLSNVTEKQVGTTTYVDASGSVIAYTPPSGTKTVVYRFMFQHSMNGDNHQIGHFKLYIDSDEVTQAYVTNGSEDMQHLVNFEWPIRVGGTANTATGRVASWTSAKTLKLQYREYGSSNESRLHTTSYTDGTANDTFVMPRIGITALTT